MGLRAYPMTATSSEAINNLVRTHMPLARKIAWQIHGRVRDLLDIDDMIQIGMTALIEAAQRFQDTDISPANIQFIPFLAKFSICSVGMMIVM